MEFFLATFFLGFSLFGGLQPHISTPNVDADLPIVAVASLQDTTDNWAWTPRNSHATTSISFPSSQLAQKTTEFIVKYKPMGVNGGLSAQQATVQNVNLQQLNRRFNVSGERKLFGRRTGTGMQSMSSVRDIKNKFSARAARASKNMSAPNLDNYYILEVAPGVNPLELIKEYQRNGLVESIEENKKVAVFALPNDTYLDSDQDGKWAMGAVSLKYEDLWGLKTMGMADAWANSSISFGNGIIVAVVDTGVDYRHEDIAANMWINVQEILGNGIDDDDNGYVDDVYGYNFVGNNGNPMDDHYHGTHVAGTIAGVGNNRKGIIGVASKAKIMAVKGLSFNGSGDISDLAMAIEYAVENGADVINNSWGGQGYSSIIADAITDALAMGCVVVNAAGNAAMDMADFFPANTPGSIAVAAVRKNSDQTISAASFSNFGSGITVAAPGQYILSTQASVSNPTVKYMSLSGTSMAAPHVAGEAALILANKPYLSVEQVIATIKASATYDPAIPAVNQGAGIANAYAALTYGGLVPPWEQNTSPVLVTIDNKIINENQPLWFTISAKNYTTTSLTYTVSGLPPGAVFSNQQFTWTPTYMQAGIYFLTFRAVNSQGAFDEKIMMITVKNVYQPPVLARIGDKIINENQGLSFLVQGGETEGVSLNYSVTGLPEGAVFVSQRFNWTPSYLQSGCYPLTFSITDGLGGQTMESVIITVNNVNRVPFVAPLQDMQMSENQLVSFQVMAIDPDNDSLTYTVSGLPSGATFTNQVFSWTPNYIQSGRYTLYVRVTDSNSGFTQVPVNIVVNDVNRSPVITQVENQLISENHFFQLAINSMDLDNDPLYYSFSSLPVGMIFANTSLLWTPTYTQAGIYPITVSVTDGKGGQDVVAFSISVNNVYQKPILAHIGNKTVNENQALTFTLTAAQTEQGPLLFSVTELPLGAVFTRQQFSWTPSFTQAGIYPLTLSVTDGSGTQISEAITITVINVNRPPVMSQLSSLVCTENDVITFAVTATDLDGDPLVYSVVGLPIGASFVNQVFSWTPSYNQAGNYALTFSVKDGQGGQTMQQVVMVVRDINRPPVFVKMANQIVSENQFLTFTFNGQDPDNDVLSYSVLSLPKGAIVNNQRVSWLPTFTQAGKYPVTFTVNDNNGLFDTMVVIISVNNVVQKPVLSKMGNQKIAENQLLEFHVSASQTEPGQPIFSASEIPLGAVFVNQIFSWTPTYTQAGSYPLKLIYTDGGGGVASESLVITVENVNRLPVLTVPESLELSEAESVTFAVTAIDLDGDPLVYSAVGLPIGASFVNQVFSWTPSYNQAGNYALTFSVKDGQGGQTLQQVAMVVRDINRPPVFVKMANQIVSENQLLTFTLNGQDPDNDVLSYGVSSLTKGAIVNNQRVSWLPTFTQAGKYPVTFTVNDNNGLSDTMVVIISVNNVVQKPVLTKIGSQKIAENQLLEFHVSANQTEPGQPVFSASEIPLGAVFDNQIFLWTPTYTQAGSYPLKLIYTDGRGVVASESLVITVENVNRPPVLTVPESLELSEAQFVTFAVTAIDLDGDPLAFNVAGLPAGALFVNQVFSWTPSYNQAGDFAIIFSVFDKTTTVSSVTSIHVENVNRLPVITLLADQIISENQGVSIKVAAMDPDGDALTYTLSGLPYGASFLNRTLTWTPTYVQSGVYPLVFSVQDTSGGIATKLMTITVNNVYQSPVLTGVANHIVFENQLVNFKVIALQTEAVPLVYSISGLPNGAVFDNQQFSWTPSYTQAGRYSITINVLDGLSGNDAKSMIITVNDFNRLPVFLPLSDVVVSENQLVSFCFNATDPDGDTLNFSMSPIPSGATFTNQTFTWTPNYLQSGIYTLALSVTDGKGGVGKAAMTIQVNNVNRLPLMGLCQSIIATENDTIAVRFSATDPDGDALTYVVDSLPAGALFFNQLLTWKPSYTQAGIYPITLFVTDVLGGTTQTSVIITVNNKYQLPVLASIPNQVVNENSPIIFSLSAFQTEGLPLTFSMENLPAGAIFVKQVFSWTPSYNQSGRYLLSAVVSDGLGGEDRKIIIVTVNNVNRSPAFLDMSDKSSSENQLITFSVTAVDPDGDILTYSVTGLPIGATFKNNMISWTPSLTQSGYYSLTFTVVDTLGLSDKKIIGIMIQNINRPPVIAPIENPTISENQMLSLTLSATDPDNEYLTYSIIGRPMGAVFSNQTFTWIPAYTQAGVYPVTFSVSDRSGGVAQLPVIITVKNVYVAPLLTKIADKTVNEGQQLMFYVQASGTEVSTLIYEISQIPQGAEFNNQVFTWTPTYTQSGVYMLAIKVTDLYGGSDSQTLCVTVNRVNRPPIISVPINPVTIENQVISFNVTAVDPDGTSVILSVAGLPDGAVFANNILTWTPTFFQSGRYLLTFKAIDREGGISSANLIIVVENVNRHPVLQPIPDKVVSENQQLTILLDATDLDNDTLKFMLIKAPPGALLSQQVLTWLPNYSMAGVYLVTIAVDDGVGGTDVKSCVITVNHVNRLPVIDYIPNKIVAENQPVAIVVSATDADNDALIYSSDNLPEGAIFSGQVFTWVPTSKQSGKYNLNFIVTDSNGGVAQRQVIIVVNNVNRPPVLPPIRFKLLRGTEPFSFLIYAFDPDDDVLTFSMTGNPSGATINNGVFQWTPGLDQVGIYRIKLIVSDALGGIAKRYMYLIVFNDLQDLNGFVTALSPVPTSDLTPGSEFYTQRIMPDASFMSLIGLPAGVFPVAMTLKQLMMNAEGLADYSPYISNTIESGKGAWLMSTQDIMVFYGSDDVTTMDKIVSLAAGWNLISNPMVTSLNWLSVRVNVNGKFYTMTQAINQGFVQNGIHTYSNAADVFQNDLLLQPWHGYFVYINQPLNIIFPAQSSTVKLEPENVAASNLSILVKLNNGTWTRSVRLLAGTVLSSAEDILSPPWAPSQNFDVWVQNGSRSLKSCRVNQNSDVLEWTITVRSRCSQRLSLQFSQEFSQSDKIYSYYVLDQNQRRNMGVANLFFDVVTGDTTYKIQGVSAAAASGISSVINYPNPFNPAFGETVKLNYTLSDIMSGTVKIYSIHGKLIRTISVEGANATSGVHTGISMWDGRDESSIIVPSELYVYVMNLSTSDGTHFKKSGKILLWKQ